MTSRPRFSVRACAVLAAVAVFTSCSHEASRTFTAPSAVTGSSGVLLVEGPSQVPPGQLAGFTARLTRPGRPSEDVTTRAEWRSTKPDVASVDTGGEVRAQTIGEVTIEAQYEGLWAARWLRVVPDDTFVLSGLVTPHAQGLTARIQVSGGTGPPVSTETSVGLFRVLGVGGRVRVDVQMEGFQPQSVELDVVADAQRDFSLTLDASQPGWRVAVETSGTCNAVAAVGVPSLSTDVRMTLRDGLVLMAPMDATVTFIGRSTSDSLSLLIAGEDDGSDFYPPSLTMRSSDGKTFEITGRVEATRDGSRFTGSFRGYVSTPAEPSEYGYCYADDHRITLTPK